jgi:hypothetical protein
MYPALQRITSRARVQIGLDTTAGAAGWQGRVALPRQRGGVRELRGTPRATPSTSTAVINDIVATKEPLTYVKALASKWPANYIPDSNEPSRFPAVQIFTSFFYE